MAFFTKFQRNAKKFQMTACQALILLLIHKPTIFNLLDKSTDPSVYVVFDPHGNRVPTVTVGRYITLLDAAIQTTEKYGFALDWVPSTAAEHEALYIWSSLAKAIGRQGKGRPQRTNPPKRGFAVSDR
eukprot:UN07552